MQEVEEVLVRYIYQVEHIQKMNLTQRLVISL